MQILVSASSDAEVGVSPVYNTSTLYANSVKSTPYPWNPYQSFCSSPMFPSPYPSMPTSTYITPANATVIQLFVECIHSEYILYQETLVHVMAAKGSTDLLGLLTIFVSNMRNAIHLLHRDHLDSRVNLETFITMAVFHVCMLFGHHSFLPHLWFHWK